ncbi:MAG: TolC family protein [Planctomyces sp.]|nr:TolC family protein [Planctomyces sp.]
MGQPQVDYLGEPGPAYEKTQATEVDYPVVQTTVADEIAASLKPHTIRDRNHSEIRDLTLAEAIHTSLQANDVIRNGTAFLSLQNPLFQNPNFVASVYDPAIQESGVLFGTRGVEAALADFDAQYTTQLIFSGNEFWNNNFGGLTNQNTATWQNSLSKTFANGGTVEVNHDVNYLRSNAPFNLFDSSYSGSLNFNYRQPLLAGAGTEFTRIAGPIARSFGGITGVSQGVVIARINNDITISDLEIATRNLLLDVENAYWDLYFAYRVYDTAVIARNAALDAWRLTKKQAGEVVIPAEEAQARNAYYAARSAAQTAQSTIFTNETRLRRLMGLAVNEGAVLRPIDEPVTAEVVPDWQTSLSDALSKRVELRRQKWNIKSLELQLTAAESLTRPRLDMVTGYQINGFGNHLLDSSGGGSPPDGFYNSMSTLDQTGWGAGVQMNIPIGFRAQLAQVRNHELRLAKAHKVLAAQELEVGHELAAAFQELDRAYGTMRSNYLRFLAAEDDVRLREPRYRNGEELVDTILRAYERRAEAESVYYRSVTEYNRAIANLELRRGTLLEYNNVHVSEGYWRPEAYGDAARQAKARAYAEPDDALYHSPQAFASDVPVDEVRIAPAVMPAEIGLPPEPVNPALEPLPTPLEDEVPAALPEAASAEELRAMFRR